MAHRLTADPGQVPAWKLLPRFMMMDTRLAIRRLARRAGLIHLKDISAEAPRAPDSAICRRARELAAQGSPPFLLNHAQRTYCFGAILAERAGLKLDREVFFVAAILHDIALVPPANQEQGSFEWVGARRAHGFCLEQGMQACKADLVHEAIALHAAVGITHRREPEVAMVHFGAGADVIGIRIDEIPPTALRQVLEHYPRLEFKTCFATLIAKEAARKPASHMAGHVGLGFAARIARAPFPE